MLFDYLLLILAYLASAWRGEAWLSSWPVGTGPVAAAGSVLAAAGLSAWTVASLARRMRDTRRPWASLLGSLARSMLLLRLGLLALFVATVHLFPWGAFVRDWMGLASVPGVREAVILVPFLLAWLASGFFLFRLEGDGERLGPYLTARARAAGGLLGMLCAGGGAVQAALDSPALNAFFEAHPWAAAGSAAVFAAALLLAVPILLRVIWTTAPLPPGDLEKVLAAWSRGAGFGYREIRVWDPGNAEALNAAVAGLLPRLRIVFLSRGLVEKLGGAEILAVFAHEAGHVKRGHAFLGMGLGLGWGGFMLAADGGILPVSGAAALAVQAGITAAFALLYGAVSRRLERQADLWAAEALGDVDLVASTLTKVAALHGDAGSARSLTHGSVASRVAFLRRVASQPAERERFEEGLWRLAGAVLILMTLGLAAAAPRFLP